MQESPTEEGRAAYHDGELRTANPHYPGDVAHAEWQYGWDDEAAKG